VTPANTTDVVQFPSGTNQPTRESELAALEKAVYAHIRALRALGRVSVNTAEIASALNVSISEVESTIQALLRKGVKVST
jgi:biotin operon repressor